MGRQKWRLASSVPLNFPVWSKSVTLLTQETKRKEGVSAVAVADEVVQNQKIKWLNLLPISFNFVICYLNKVPDFE